MSNRFAGIHDSAKNTVQAFLQKWGSLFTPGVANKRSSTSWRVSQRGAGANMSIDIAAGDGLLYDVSFPYQPWTDAAINKGVSVAPSGGNSRKDIVVAYINEAAITTASNNGLDAFDFMVVDGVAAASPSDPSDGTIQAAVGSGNPWVKLARITVPTSAPSILDGYITDLRAPIAFAGNLWGGSNNTVGHTVPNVVDKYVALTSGTDGRPNAANIDFGGNGSGIWWEEIGRTTLVSASDTISVASFTAKKYLMVIVSAIPTGGAVRGTMRFNNDPGSNYAVRVSVNGAGDATAVSQNSIAVDVAAAEVREVIHEILNIQAQEKEIYTRMASAGTAGAGNLPQRVEAVSKWSNTTAQITRVDIINDQAGDFAAGSELIILGHN
jgi:hypothetical protein